MRALILCTLVVAARAFYASPALGARFSYGYTAASPVFGGLGFTRAHAAAPLIGGLGLTRAHAAAPFVSGLGFTRAHAAPLDTVTQSHSQDELGQYTFGYASGNSARKEMKTADGVVRGSYSYIDSFGIPQKVNYVADALGFRVAATNLPVAPLRRKRSLLRGAPLALGMRAAPLGLAMGAAPLAMGVRAAPLAMGFRSYAPARGFAYSVNSVNPMVTPRAMLAAKPVLATGAMMAPMGTLGIRAAVGVASPASGSAQHHSQDELGQYNYGYADMNSAKKEMKTADGVVRGSYSYTDSFGIPQKVNYVADALGFRVAATNLPVAPAPVAPVAARIWG